MTHPTRGLTAARRLQSNAPADGLVLNAPPHRLPATALADALNLHHRHGRLCTRPGLQHRGTLAGGVPLTGAVPLAHCTLLYGLQNGRLTVALLAADGTLTGTTHTLPGVTGVCAVPAGSESFVGTRYAAVLYTDGARGLYGVSDTGALTALTPHVPTVLTAGTPTDTAVYAPGGAAGESYNLLAGDCLCGYTANGTGVYYWLPRSLSPDLAAELSVTYDLPNAGPVTHYLSSRAGTLWSEAGTEADGLSLRYDSRLRTFWFVGSNGQPTALPAADTADNVRLHAVQRLTGVSVYAMRFGCWFGGSTGGAHLFLSGAADAPATLVWSAAGNPCYLPADNTVSVGTDATAVTALAPQDDRLVVFKERALYTVTLGTAAVPTAAQALAGAAATDSAITLTALHAACGCDCPGTVCLCGNRLVWLCQNGRVFTLVSGGLYDRRCVRALSAPVEPALAGESAADLAAATAVYTGTDYRLLVGRTVYVLACGTDGAVRTASYASDTAHTVWHRWQVDFPACDPPRMAPVDTAALVLSRTAGGVLCAHAFVPDTAADSVPQQAGDTLTFAAVPVPVRACTGHRDLGFPHRRKQVLSLRLWVARGADAPLTVSLCDGPVTRRVAQWPPAAVSDATVPHRVPPPVGTVGQCGLMLETAGPFAWDGWELTYRPKGDIAHGEL